MSKKRHHGLSPISSQLEIRHGSLDQCCADMLHHAAFVVILQISIQALGIAKIRLLWVGIVAEDFDRLCFLEGLRKHGVNKMLLRSKKFLFSHRRGDIS